MRAGHPRSPVTETLASNNSALLPFVPTLATALAVAALALVCRPAATPESRPAATIEAMQMGADGFHAADGPARTPTLGTNQAIPAALAFGKLHLPAFATDETAKRGASTATAGRPAHMAVQSPAPSAAASRRACTAGSRCGEAHRSETARGPSVPNPTRPTAEPAAAPSRLLPFFPVTPEPDDDVLPKDALPYASTAAAWVDSVRKLGGRIGDVGESAASVGGSVVELIACVR